jgi:hypothetical protein
MTDNQQKEQFSIAYVRAVAAAARANASVTIDIPRRQVFSVEALQAMFRERRDP